MADAPSRQNPASWFSAHDLAGAVTARLGIAFDRAGVKAAVLAGLDAGTAPPRTPAVLVFLIAEDAGESISPQAGAYQRITATLAVVHVVAAANQARGASAMPALSGLTKATRSALNGWRPAAPMAPSRRDTLALRRGRLIDLSSGRAIWQDEYSISWRASCVQEEQKEA